MVFMLFMVFHNLLAWAFENGKRKPAALIETLARLQAGLSLSGDFHSISSIFTDFHRFVKIFYDFHVFS